MKKSFTLIELLIVIAIIGILVTLGLSSYTNSIKSGKDARRKSDLATIQKGLEIYYQDNQAYPAPVANAVPNTGGSFCHPSGCATAKYLQVLPTDPGGTTYYYVSSGPNYQSYQLYSCIENANDTGPGVNQTGYGVSCGSGRCNPCRFGISSTNTNP